MSDILKAATETQFRVTSEKTVALGQRIDIVLALIRIGFFYNDKDLVHRNILKGKTLIEEGGDWDRRNRLKIYEAYYLMSSRDFSGATKLFLESLASFSAEELFDYKRNVFYTVLCSLITLDRVALKNKVCSICARFFFFFFPSFFFFFCLFFFLLFFLSEIHYY